MPDLIPTKRAFWLNNLGWAFGTLIGYFLGELHSRGKSPSLEDFLTNFLGIILVWAIGSLITSPSLQDHYSIEIFDTHISGPSGWMFRRSMFPLGEIDIAKSSRQSFFQRLLGIRYIWSVGKERIVVNLLLYPQIKRTEFFRHIESND